MKTLKPFLFLLVIFTVEAQASKGGLPLDLKKYPREVRFTRHHIVQNDKESGLTDTISQASWREGSTGFNSARTYHRKTHGYSKCETFLSEQQDYALKKMANTEYIDSEEAAFYSKLGHIIDRQQVGSYETHRIIPSNDPILKTIDERHFVREASSSFEDVQNIRTAHVWSYAGQKPDPATSSVVISELPWQLDPVWAEEAKKFDRKKHMFVWEWGRAAQDLAGDILPLYHANTISNLLELLTYKGPLDRAFVMLHSLAKSNTKIYEAAFPGTRYADKGEDNVLFLVPLSEVLKRYPPSAFSTSVAGLKKILPEIPDEYLVALIRQFRNSMWLEADIMKGRQIYKQPLVVMNWSASFIAIEMKYALNYMGVSEDRYDKVIAYLYGMKNGNGMKNNEAPQYSDVTEEYMSGHFLNGTQTMEISNIPEFMRKDKDALKRIILETFFFKLENIDRPFTPNPQHHYQYAEGFIKMDFQIVVSTFDSVLSETLQSMGGQLKEIPEMQLDHHPLPGEKPQGKLLRTLRMVSFPLADLKKLSRQEPHLLDESSYYVRELQHSIEYYLRQVEQF